MNNKVIMIPDRRQAAEQVWAQFGRIIKDKKSQQVIEKRLTTKTLNAGDLYRLNIVGSGIVFGQVLSGGF